VTSEPAGGDAASALRGTAGLADAARRVLAGDGGSHILQPWQIAYCFALVEGREPVVPPGCGVGKGWLEARLREAQRDLSGAADAR
jgi:hypothetical protein